MTNTSAESPINPNEDLAIPKWINEEYLQAIIEEDEPNFVKILNFTPVAATQPGENYSSIMIRIYLEILLKDGNTKKTSYILKTALEAGTQGAALVQQLNFFLKEKQTYQKILPRYHKLYAEAGEDIKFSPKCLNIAETPESITLVMEDLKQQNFINVDRLEGFDMTHMTCVLRKLAELHAASAVDYELNGAYDEIYTKSFYSEDSRQIFQEMYKGRVPIFEKALRTWGLENVEYYIAKAPTVDAYFDEGVRAYTVDPAEFNVLNHGDCWSNNIMFNYKENGDINQCLLVDYQIGKWATPALDLWYVIVNSANLNIKVSQYDHFIHIYHKRLVECLKLLKYTKKIPSLKEIHIMMIKYGFYAVNYSRGVLVAIRLPTDKDASIESMMKPGPEGDAFRYKCFCNPYYVKAMCQLYPFFDNKGFLDF